MSDRINARLSKPLSDHVKRMVGSEALYETPSEYIRALIRKDMENETSQLYNKIIEGFTDIKEGRVLESSGSWEKDKELFREKLAQNWK